MTACLSSGFALCGAACLARLLVLDGKNKQDGHDLRGHANGKDQTMMNKEFTEFCPYCLSETDYNYTDIVDGYIHCDDCQRALRPCGFCVAHSLGGCSTYDDCYAPLERAHEDYQSACRDIPGWPNM